MPDLVIQSHAGPYRVRFGGPFEGLASTLKDKAHLVIDAKVAELYADQLADALEGRPALTVEATEAAKSLERMPDYVLALLAQNVRRDHVLIAVGGGIVQDIVAFVAATLLRGLPWRFYPTTLLAQADSCIGSKSSINVGGHKNQLGTFTPPREIDVSMDVLDTLSAVEVRSGLGEIIKVHVIAGWEQTRALAVDYPSLTRDKKLLASYVRRSLEIKKAKVEVDEFDRRERLVMNYGHTFGHAIESATDYGVPHGIAVTIGMDLANHVSCRFGLAPKPVWDEIHPLLAANYAGFEKIAIPEDRFFAALARDKKNRGQQVSLVLLRQPGDVFVDGYPSDARLRDVCREYFNEVRG